MTVLVAVVRVLVIVAEPPVVLEEVLEEVLDDELEEEEEELWAEPVTLNCSD